jgi:predicted Ser/Thr protein kinase
MLCQIDNTKFLRQLVRTGRAEAAAKHLAGINDRSLETAVEAELLALLQFENPSDSEAQLETIAHKDLAPDALARWFMARGICANRLRDPIAALAALQQGIEVARGQDDKAGLGEIILERARVHSWMGSFARAHEDLAEALLLSSDVPYLRLTVLLRYVDMYAEAERWPQAERFIARALQEVEKIDGSVHVWQLIDCAVRVEQAQKRPAEKYLSYLAEDEHRLPDYLKFRLAVAQMRESLRDGNLNVAKSNLDLVNQFAGRTYDDSYEKAVAMGLDGEMRLLAKEPDAALPLLIEAASWFEARDLAVPRIRFSMLQAEALMVVNKPEAAARLLSSLRDYCGRRGLQLQREAIDLAQQRYGLPRMAEVETDRAIKFNEWNNARAYVILGELGQGGQGTVFKAYDTARDRVVAFKKLALNADAFRLLQNEVESLCRAQMPGVARVIACGTAEDGIAYVTQEFVEGQNLRSAQKDRTTLAQLVQLAAIIDKLHANGLCHGDIKPENVIITPEGNPVLVDFGAARYLPERQTQSAATRAYLPHGFGARLLSPVARDQFAFGLILLEILTGTDPSHRIDWQRGSKGKEAKTVAQMVAELRTTNKRHSVLHELLVCRICHMFRKPKTLAEQVHGLLS